MLPPPKEYIPLYQQKSRLQISWKLRSVIAQEKYPYLKMAHSRDFHLLIPVGKAPKWDLPNYKVPQPLEKDDQGHFHANIALEKPDKISFKFIVDGKWETSPYYPSELDGSVLLINSGSLEQLCLCLPLMPNPLRLLFLLITLLLESLAAAGGSYEVSNHTLPCNYTAKDYKCDVMLGPNSYVSLNSIVFYAIVISVVDEPSNADAWKMMLQLPQLL